MANQGQNVDEALPVRTWGTLDPDVVRQVPAENRTPSGTAGHDSTDTHNCALDSPSTYTRESAGDRRQQIVQEHIANRPPSVPEHLATERIEPFLLNTIFAKLPVSHVETHDSGISSPSVYTKTHPAIEKGEPSRSSTLFEERLQHAHEIRSTKDAASGKPLETPYKSLPELPDSITTAEIRQRHEIVKAEAESGLLSTVGKRLNREYSQLLAGNLGSKVNIDLLKAKEAHLTEHEAYRAKWSDRDRKLEQQLGRYKTLSLYARYGDYLASEYTTLCKDYREAKQLGSDGPSVLCTEFFKSLRLEEDLAKNKAGRGNPMWEKAVWERGGHARFLQMCDGNKDAARSTVTFIHEYGTRNELMHAGFKQYIHERNWNELAARTADDLDALDRLFDFSDEFEKRKRDDLHQAICKVRDRWLTLESGTWVPLRAVTMAESAGIQDLGPFADMDKTASDNEINLKIQEACDEAERRAEDQARALAANALVSKQKAAKLVDKYKLALAESTQRNSELEKIANEMMALQQTVEVQEKAIQERDATLG